MITIPVNINECSDIKYLHSKQINYTYAFHKVHKKIHKINDLKFIKHIQKKFLLTDIEVRSLISEVKVKFEQTTTNKKNQEERIVSLTDEIKYINENKKSIKNTRKIFKKNKKIKEIENSLQIDITFGTKEQLRKITKLHNQINVINKIEDVKKREKELVENALKIKEERSIWDDNRLLHFYILGEANQKGNRFFEFDFKNKTLIYKPKQGVKIVIKYSCTGNHQQKLLQIQELINNKEISVTLNVSEKQVCIAFDDEILSGYYIDKKERTKEVKYVKEKCYSKEQTKEIITKIYAKYYENLRKQKLENKVKNRYISIDKNPEYIGYCIADKGYNGIKKIIKSGVIDFRKLNTKLKLASNDELKIHQNNKREFEIQNAIKRLFEMAIHYQVAYFIEEDIDNISKKESFDCHESNYKVKNIWHRKLTDWQIKKRCIENGIELILINPVYTSFIGNILYDNFDATNAAIEICRRGMFKFNKGLFYPQLTSTISDTMSKIFEQQIVQLNLWDAQIFKDCRTWTSLYKTVTNNGLRWRWDWDRVVKSSSVFRLSNENSKVLLVEY